MSVAALAVVIGRLLALVAVGVALRVSGLLKADDARVLNVVIIYVALPALIFRAIQPAALGWDLVLVAVVAWIAGLAGFALAYVASRLLRLSRPTAGGLMLTSALGNTGYIGYPVALGLLGSAGLVKAVFYDVFGTVGVLLTVGVLVCAAYGESEEKPHVLREFLTFPPFLAVLAALTLKSASVPAAVSDWLDLLAKVVVPLIMISLGLSLEPRAIGRYAGPLSVVGALKLIALPLIALLAGRVLLASDPVALRLVVLQAGMPTMMLAVVFGARFRLDVELIAGAALVTTVAAILTIPALQALAG